MAVVQLIGEEEKGLRRLFGEVTTLTVCGIRLRI